MLEEQKETTMINIKWETIIKKKGLFIGFNLGIKFHKCIKINN